MLVTELIEKAGFTQNTEYTGEVYGHSATKMLLLVKENKVSLLSENHRVLSTIESADAFTVLGALLYLTRSAIPGSTTEKTLYTILK